MQRSEFDQLLNQFPVVRSKQHRREWYSGVESGSAGSRGTDAAAALSSSAVAAAAASSSPSAPVVSSAASPSQSSSVQPAAAPVSISSTSSSTSSSLLSTGLSSSGSDFYALLGAHLRATGFSDAVASATVSHFRDAHRQTLAGLALDEMDIVARSIGAARAQRHKQQQQLPSPHTKQQSSQPPQAGASPTLAPAAGIDLMVD